MDPNETHGIDGEEELETDFHTLLATIVSAVYGVISIGFFSNIIVGIVVGNILLRLGSALPNRHMLVYVFALCIVDALVLGTLPMLIIQIYLQAWIFGETLCSVYWIIDSINKTLSTFILLCLSFDRYLAVRFPHRCMRIRTVRGALFILFSCVIFAALLLMPVYLHAEITYVDIDVADNVTGGNGTKVPTCAFVGQTSFIFTIFILCYFVPFACMSFFYGSMLVRLRRRSKKLGVRQGRIRRVTTKTLTLVISYFICWTPYWAVTLHHVVTEALRDYDNDSYYDEPLTTFSTPTNSTVLDDDPGLPNNNLLWNAIRFALLYATHSGCYLNSAINPILYALLNRELRRQHYAAMSLNNRPGGSQLLFNSGILNGNAKVCVYGSPSSPNLMKAQHHFLAPGSRTADVSISPSRIATIGQSVTDHGARKHEKPKCHVQVNKKHWVSCFWRKRTVKIEKVRRQELQGRKSSEYEEKDFIRISKQAMKEVKSCNDGGSGHSLPVLL